MLTSVGNSRRGLGRGITGSVGSWNLGIQARASSMRRGAEPYMVRILRSTLDWAGIMVKTRRAKISRVHRDCALI